MKENANGLGVGDTRHTRGTEINKAEGRAGEERGGSMDPCQPRLNLSQIHW